MRLHAPMIAQRILLSQARSSVTRLPWVCRSCRAHISTTTSTPLSSPFSGWFSVNPTPPTAAAAATDATNATTATPKPFYITTPIFYVNAAPHIGHLHSMVLADVLKRWHMLVHTPPSSSSSESSSSESSSESSSPESPPTALLSTGTDEHGLKVQQAAEHAAVSPQSLCDANSKRFRDLADAASVSHDFFVRTTAPEHRAAVQHFWTRLVEGGHVYRAPRAGWYSVGDECFYKDAEVERRVHPRTGTVKHVAAATGSEVVWTEEENWHFRLTAFKDQLLAWYGENGSENGGENNGNPPIIQPVERQNEVVSWIRTSLSDLSISRPSSRLTWGIPVPGDPSQTIYVWVDALVNYIVQAGYPDAPGFHTETSPWPADIHVIGKDILRFHCVYWPALLMAAGLPLPRSFLAHAHWTMNRRKMSKSLGNVVDPVQQLRRWGPDPLRYFLMAEAGAMPDDKDYGNTRVLMRYRELMSKLGNTFNRIKKFDIENSVEKVLIYREVPLAPGRDSSGDALYMKLHYLPDAIADAMARKQLPLANFHIMETMTECHRLCDEVQPWNRMPEDPVLISTVFLIAEASRIAAIALQPIMPAKMALLLDMLGVTPDRRSWRWARIGLDASYGESLAEPEGGVLFPRLEPFLLQQELRWEKSTNVVEL